MDGFVLDEKLSFKMVGLSFSSKLDEAYTAPPPKKIGFFIHSLKFLLRFSIISINRPSGLAWNNVSMPELVLLVAFCICCIFYRKW